MTGVRAEDIGFALTVVETKFPETLVPAGAVGEFVQRIPVVRVRGSCDGTD